MLAGASYIFYASWNSFYLILILLSTTLDYLISINIEDTKSKTRKKILLILSIVANLGVLAIFKYYNFFIDSAFIFFSNIGIPFQYTSLQLLLPVGISFYTFQSMSYTIDVYKGEIKAERRPENFALYIAFFPQLVAGPIVRPKEFLPQLKFNYSITRKQFYFGLGLMLIGIAKKVLFADYFAIYADNYFSAIANMPGIINLLIGTYAFAFQIYFDFSGYTDTAIGAALLLGFRIPRNFLYPYTAVSFSDFWRRWHISLSTWMRDYIYIPLGGNKNGKKARNIFITMVISGLWHGAAWNFVIWGVMHGVFSTIEIKFQQLYKRLQAIFKRLIIFNMVCLAWILFRIENLSDISKIFGNLTVSNQLSDLTLGAVMVLIFTPLLLFYQYFADKYRIKNHILESKLPIQFFFHLGLFLAIYTFGNFGSPFIYFQF